MKSACAPGHGGCVMHRRVESKEGVLIVHLPKTQASAPKAKQIKVE